MTLFNKILFSTVLSLMIFSGTIISYHAFASPIFETDTTVTGAGNFLPEQSITINFDSVVDMDVAVDGVGVHTIWIDGAAGQLSSLFYQYTDDVTFEPATGDPYFVDIFGILGFPPSPISDSLLNECNAASQPKVKVTSTHIFIAWLDQQDTDCDFILDGVNRIGMVAIDKAFGPPHFYDIFSNPPVYHTTDNLPTSFSMDANGQFAYITWDEDDGVDSDIGFLRFDGDAFVNFTGPPVDSVQNLDSTISNANPDIIASQTGLVYVAWEDTDNNDIKFAYDSVANPFVFTTNSIDVNPATVSKSPKMAEGIDVNTSVHIAWTEGPTATNQINVAKYISGNLTTVNSISSVSTNLGSSINHQIVAGIDDVYVVWQDNLNGADVSEILVASSTNAGSTYSTPLNISTSSGDSIEPKIAQSSSGVSVIWRDDTFANDPFNQILGQVWLKSSIDSGSTFGGLEIISEATTDATVNVLSAGAANAYPVPKPNIATSDDIVAVVWSPDLLLAPGMGLFAWDGSFKAGTPSSVDLSFDETEYAVSDAAVLTLVDPSNTGSGSVNVDVTNINQALTLTETLNETAPGIFTVNIDLGGTYSASLGDLFRADYVTGAGPIFTTFSKVLEIRSVSFIPFIPSLDLGDFIGLEVNDQTANLDPLSIDSVTVTVTSTTDPVGVDIILDETGINSGLFSGTSNIAFMNGVLTPLVTDKVIITQSDVSSPDPLAIQTVSRNILSTSDPVGVNIELTETGLNTDVYSASFTFCMVLGCSDGPTKKLEGTPGDFITFQQLGGTIKSNGMIFPDNINDRGVLLVTCVAGTCDMITASYSGLSVNASVDDPFSSGGGGGGISRAGLVFNAAGGASLFGGSSFGGSSIDSVGPPSFGSESFVLSRDGQKLDPQSEKKTLKVGKSSDISMGFLMPGGLGVLDHLGLYVNIGEGETKYDTDTFIYYDKYKTPKITIHDPHEFFKSVDIDVKETSRNNLEVSFNFDFAKAMKNSDVVFETWNLARQSAQIDLPGLLDVEEEPNTDNTEPPSIQTPIEQKEDSRPPVPDWVKSNAGWWGQGQIDDDTFTNGIGFLIQNSIIDVPDMIQSNMSPDPEQKDQSEPEFSSTVPDWVKNTALWWSQDNLTDDDFLNGIKYLVEHKIIKVRI